MFPRSVGPWRLFLPKSPSNSAPAKWRLIIKREPPSATRNRIPPGEGGHTYSQFPSAGAELRWQVLALPGTAAPFRGPSFISAAARRSKAAAISGRLGSDALFVLCMGRFISRHYGGLRRSFLVPYCTAWAIFIWCDLLLVSSCGFGMDYPWGSAEMCLWLETDG